MKSEQLCKMLMTSLTIPLNATMETDFAMLKNSVIEKT